MPRLVAGVNKTTLSEIGQVAIGNQAHPPWTASAAARTQKSGDGLHPLQFEAGSGLMADVYKRCAVSKSGDLAFL